MNWTITFRKFLEGAAEGGIAAAMVLAVSQDDPNYWAALAGAVVVGAIRGGLNAIKNRDR